MNVPPGVTTFLARYEQAPDEVWAELPEMRRVAFEYLLAENQELTAARDAQATRNERLARHARVFAEELSRTEFFLEEHFTLITGNGVHAKKFSVVDLFTIIANTLEIKPS
jgi:glutathione S-transferase